MKHDGGDGGAGGDRGRRRRDGVAGGCGSRFCCERGRPPEQTFEDRRERANRLWHAVFQDLEIGLGQILDRLAAPVAHDDIDEDRGDAFFDGADRPLRLLRLARSANVIRTITPATQRKNTCVLSYYFSMCPPTDCAPLRCVRRADRAG